MAEPDSSTDPGILSSLRDMFTIPRSTTSYMNPNALEMRRRIALQLMAQGAKKGYPKTVGEGLASIGDAFTEGLAQRQLMAQEAAYQNYIGAQQSKIQQQAPPGPQAAAEPQEAPARIAAVDPAASDPAIAAVVAENQRDETPAVPTAGPAAPPPVAAPPSTLPAPATLAQANNPQITRQVQPPQAAPVMMDPRMAGGARTPPNPMLSQLPWGDTAVAGNNLAPPGARGGGFPQVAQAPPMPTPPRIAQGFDAMSPGYTPVDARADATLKQVINLSGGPTGNRYGYPQTASRGDMGSDAPDPGISPTGGGSDAGIGAGVIDTMQLKDQMARDLMYQNPARGVPPQNPTLGGATVPPTTGPSIGAGGQPDPRLAQALPPAAPPGTETVIPPAPKTLQFNRTIPPVTMPGQSTVKLPDPAPIGPQERELMRLQTLGDPTISAQAEPYLKAWQALRTQQNADAMKQYEQDKQLESQRRSAYEATQTPAGLAAASEAASKAEVAAQDARLVKRTGMTADKLYPYLDAEQKTAQQAIAQQNAQQLARKAIRDGVITGYGDKGILVGDKFAAWAWNNGLRGDRAANTEIMRASLQNGIRQALDTIIGAGGRVTQTEVGLAQGVEGTDPNLQMKTIQTLMDRASAINNARTNRYEEIHQQYVGGLPEESRFATNALPIASTGIIKVLLDSQDPKNPAQANYMRQKFDEHYGPGSAELEIARAARLQRRQQQR